MEKRGTEPVCAYGRCSLRALMSGGIIGEGREIRGSQILNTRILRNASGLIQMTPHG